MSEIQVDSHTETSDTATPPSEIPHRLDDALVPLVERIRTFLMDDVRSLYRALQNDCLTPVYKAFREAAHSHEILTQGLGLDSEDAILTEKALFEYRRSVCEQVLQPLHRQLETPLSESLFSKSDAFFIAIRKAMDWEPEVQVVEEPPALFAPRDTDTSWIRFRKLLRRRRRNGRHAMHAVRNAMRRLIRRKPIEAIVYRQNIPLRGLLAYHFQVRLPNRILPEIEKIYELLAGCVARYEKAQSSWTYAVLDIEQKLATPSYALPELEPWIKAEEERTPASASPASVQRLAEQVKMLNDSLNLPAYDIENVLDAFQTLLDEASSELTDDLLTGGTFLLHMNERLVPPLPQQPLNLHRESIVRRTGWYREVNNRLIVSAALNEWRDLVVDGQGQLLKSIAAASLIPIFNSLNRLRKTLEEVHQECTTLFEQRPEADRPDQMEPQLRPLRERISGQFKFILNDLTGLLKAGQALEEPGSSLWQRLNDRAETLPDTLSVHEPTGSAPPSGISRLRLDINFKQAVADALIQPLPPQLDAPARTLQKSVVRAWEEIQQVEYTADYNLNAAFSELKAKPTPSELPGPNEAEAGEEPVPHDPFETALELIATGLVRSSEKLGELARGLNKPWRSFVDVAFKSLQSYSYDIYSNVSYSDNVQGWWTNLRIRFVRRSKRASHELTQSTGRARAWLSHLVRRGQRQTKQLIMKGQSAVGVVGQNEDQWLQMLNMVSDVETLYKRLPLVYRRLFSLNPLEELDLLEGRKLDIAFIKKHFERWQKSQTGPLILVMPNGSGRTSLLNVLAQSVFLESDVKLFQMDRRIKDIDQWAASIASVLEIPFEGHITIDMLEARLMAQSRTETPCVVVINRLEHLLLCTPGGERLIERVLIFLSRTDSAVYWIASMGQYAWHFLEKTLRPSAGFIAAYNVTQLHRQAIEDIILKRHNRSGMSLRFKGASASSSFFDFSRSKDEDTLQQTAQTAFFDRLYRLCGQNILLALVYWLRSVEFDKESDVLLVNALEPINFGFLETLDLNRVFTLKSFLIHRTLTLEEHMLVFRTTASESTIILESLLNLGILEPVRGEENTTRYFRIMPELPYRVHPLIVHPVTEFLKKLHIVY